MLGMHGTVVANYAVDHADLLLAFGVRFDDRVTGKLEAFAVLPDLSTFLRHNILLCCIVRQGCWQFVHRITSQL